MAYVWFGLAVIGWAVFGGLLVTAEGNLDQTWGWVRGRSVIAQGVMWLLLFPWMAALAIWQSTWEGWLRLTAIGGIAVANLYLFLPRGR
jgi:hypothetical protein